MTEKQAKAFVGYGRDVSELPVELLTDEEMVLGTRRLIGFNLCPGCERIFLPESTHCQNCSRMLVEFENRFVQGEPCGRINVGIANYRPSPPVEYDPGKPASRRAVGLVFVGAVCSVMFLLTGLWYVGRGLVGICLEHSTK